jgi:hypothetical protein
MAAHIVQVSDGFDKLDELRKIHSLSREYQEEIQRRLCFCVLLLFCMFALWKDERKLQYSRSNILGFINTGYFTSDNVPDGIKNATHNTFSNFRKKLATEIKISSFFRKWLNTNKRLFNI